jgi:4-amino-4-deoxy-L-arabinose transferase-like glycosyltransferase
MSGIRLLRALVLASLGALVFQTHVFVAFQPVRVKVVQSSAGASDGLVRVTTAGFPGARQLRPPFAMIARVKAPAGPASRLAIAVDGEPVCERDVNGGASRRIDCAVAVPWDPAADHQVTIQGPSTTWTLEFLELATHHGNSSGALTLFVVPRGSGTRVPPAAGWTIAVWLVLAGIVLFLPPISLRRGVRLLLQTVAGMTIAFLAVVQCSEWISAYRVVIATGTFLACMAVILAPRLGTAGRWLTDRVGRPVARSVETYQSTLAAFFRARPAWCPGGAAFRAAWHWSALALVVVFFCAPLFVNLREPDLRSDEAIHSWAVDRVLDTGDWLTPGSLPDDSAFIEKPPLKFWLVAGGIRSGLLPRNELGMRWFDALFGAIGFVYVYLLGCRLSGPLCGLTAVLVLFTLDPLVFEHGLRSNNMDAAMFLCYCGGVFHFAAWAEADRPRARGHASAAAACFTLGFMTKFVAAVFLPAVCVVAFACRRDAWARFRSGWRDWIVPALLVCGFVAPWFIYQTVKRGHVFWDIIVGTHVFQRFTASLDPTHVHPWHHYFVETWKALQRAGTHWVVLAGVGRLAVAAVRGESWRSRLVLVWSVLPVVAISLGTSKLLHYAYPFWPAIALAAGLIVADAARVICGARGIAALATLRSLVPRRVASWSTEREGPRAALIGLAAFSCAVAAWTALSGPFAVTIGGVRVGNDSVAWPLAAACGALFLVGSLGTLLRLAVICALVALAPVPVYTGEIARTKVVDHPFRAVRECMTALQQAGVKVGPGVYGSATEMEHWTYYYYLWRMGEWTIGPDYSVPEAERRLWMPGRQTPVLVSRSTYETLVRRAGLWETTFSGGVEPAEGSSDPVADAARNPLRSGARFDDNIAVLLPGPFQACLPGVLAAAGQPLWRTPASDSRR